MTKSKKRFVAALSVLAVQLSIPMWLEQSPERLAMIASCTAIIALIALLQLVLGEG